MHVILGPILLATGLVLLHLSIHGAFRPRQVRLPAIRRRAANRSRAMPSADLLVTDMLSEMLRLREEISDLQTELSSLRENAGHAA